MIVIGVMYAGGVYHVAARGNVRKSIVREGWDRAALRGIWLKSSNGRSRGGDKMWMIAHRMGLSYSGVSGRVGAVCAPLATDRRFRPTSRVGP